MPEEDAWAGAAEVAEHPSAELLDRALRDLEVVLGAAAGDPALLAPVRIPQPVPLEVWAARAGR